MPLSTYITAENVRFNGTLDNAVVLDNTANVRTLILTDGLSQYNRDNLGEFLDRHLRGTPGNLAAPTAGFATLTFGTKVGTDTTALSTAAAQPGRMYVSFTSAVTGTTPSNYRTETGVAGYQAVDFGTAKTGAATTGLTAGITYTAQVQVNGVYKKVSILGSAAQTFTALVAQLQTAVGSDATVAIVSGDIRITSNKADKSGQIVISSGTLFPAITGYVAVLPRVFGSGFNRTYSTILYVDGVAKPVSILGSNGTTLADVATQLTTALAGSATAAVVGNQLVISSATTGSSSSVTVWDGGYLFSSLAGYRGVTYSKGSTPPTYTATIVVNGVPKVLSLNGTAASTFTQLVDAITTAVGAAGTVVFTPSASGSAATIKITSASSGVGSTVEVGDTNLFTNVTSYKGATHYRGITNLLSAFVTGKRSSIRNIDEYKLQRVGLTPPLPAQPPKASLPKAPPHIYYGGSPLAWRFTKDDSTLNS